MNAGNEKSDKNEKYVLVNLVGTEKYVLVNTEGNEKYPFVNTEQIDGNEKYTSVKNEPTDPNENYSLLNTLKKDANKKYALVNTEHKNNLGNKYRCMKGNKEEHVGLQVERRNEEEEFTISYANAPLTKIWEEKTQVSLIKKTRATGVRGCSSLVWLCMDRSMRL